MALDDNVIKQVSERLGQYVYLLVDPRDSRPFYVGKGRGVRMLAHGHGLEAADDGEPAEHHKDSRIREIRAAGLQHEIWIVRYGLNNAEYTAVEAAVIDVLGSFPVIPATSGRYRPLERRDGLTNRRREDAHGKGMILLDRLVDELAAPPLITSEPLLLITLKSWGDLDEHIAGNRTRPGYGFKPEWLDPTRRDQDLELLEMATSSWWVVSPREVRRRCIRYVVPVFHGVTRGLLELVPDSWEQQPGKPSRYGFRSEPVRQGALYDEVVGPHGHRLADKRRGSQNPVSYWPPNAQRKNSV